MRSSAALIVARLVRVKPPSGRTARPLPGRAASVWIMRSMSVGERTAALTTLTGRRGPA